MKVSADSLDNDDFVASDKDLLVDTAEPARKRKTRQDHLKDIKAKKKTTVVKNEEISFLPLLMSSDDQAAYLNRLFQSHFSSKLGKSAELKGKKFSPHFIASSSSLYPDIPVEPLVKTCESHKDAAFIVTGYLCPPILGILSALSYVPWHSYIFAFIVMRDWRKALSKPSPDDCKGCPRILIVCMSATRAVELIKQMTLFSSMCKIGKLFAKHFKVEEQSKYLSENVVRIAVGTPHRLYQLASLGNLDLGQQTGLVLIDSQKDAKGRNVLESSDNSADTMALLNEYVLPVLNTSSAKIYLF